MSLATAPATDPETAAAGARLRAELAAVLDAQHATLLAGRPGAGAAAAAALSDVYDRDIITRWQRATAGVSGPLALCATGGWARRELAPASDLDFILLHRGDEASAKLVCDRLLYPLWDARVAVGHAVREPRAAARLAKDDLATATALLDVRHLVGDPELTGELVRHARGALAPGGDPNDFIGQLAAEKKRRHDRFGDSLYLLEPNLKQGIGALRDLATALWAARARWLLRGAPLPGHGETIELLARDGHLSRRQADVLLRGRDFLLGLRVLLQLASKRKGDQLTFELQEAIAPGLTLAPTPSQAAIVIPDRDVVDITDDVRPAVAPAVEALMRSYYLHARGVVQVGDRLLETARVPPRRKPQIHRIDGSFLTFNGELAVHDARVLADRPSEMLRLFRIAVDQGIAVYGHTRDLIAELAPTQGERLRADPAAARLFVDALVDLRDRGQPSALELLHQLGVVSAIMPEWAPCTCRVQHDLYHVYTVDQHQLLAVAMLKRIGRGELTEQYPVAAQAFARVTRLAPLVLGTLLHDVGKPLGKGHAEKGAVLAAAVARRLGFTEEDIEITELLVRQHLTMSHISQRRDLTDPDVIARFAERIGDEERLAQLYLLTLCDSAMTAPGNMSAWKDELLRTLYLRARAHLAAVASSDGIPVVPDGDQRRAKILAQLESTGAVGVAAVLDVVDDRFLAQLSARQAARHVRLVLATRARQARVGVAVTHLPLKGHSEVAVVAPDAHGVLAAITGALVAHRVYVLGAVVGHAEPVGAEPGLALDLFYVRDRVGAAIADDDPRWPKLEADLIALIAGGAPDPERVAALIERRRPSSGLPPRVTPAIATEIRIDNTESTEATIVEVFTRDRVGVLHAITRTLADAALDITLSKISTEGEKVADVFYVTKGGAKLAAPDEQAALRERLAQALAELP